MPDDAQKLRVKQMLVSSLQMRMAPEQIADDIALFGDEGLGFDSVDAIEIVAGVEQEFGYAFTGEDEARQALKDVQTLAAFLEERGKL
ncbi:MAG: acyl carrier protein [Planctomycetota bacterium]